MQYRVNHNQTFQDGQCVESVRVETPITGYTRAEVYGMLNYSQKTRIRMHAPEMFEMLSMATEPILAETIERHFSHLRDAGLLSIEEFVDLTTGEYL